MQPPISRRIRVDVMNAVGRGRVGRKGRIADVPPRPNAAMRCSVVGEAPRDALRQRSVRSGAGPPVARPEHRAMPNQGATPASAPMAIVARWAGTDDERPPPPLWRAREGPRPSRSAAPTRGLRRAHYRRPGCASLRTRSVASPRVSGACYPDIASNGRQHGRPTSLSGTQTSPPCGTFRRVVAGARLWLGRAVQGGVGRVRAPAGAIPPRTA